MPEVPAGAYYIAYRDGDERPQGFAVRAEEPHRAKRTATRLPEYGQTPGAMIGQQAIHAFVTQIGEGCSIGVGKALAQRVVACDLVR